MTSFNNMSDLLNAIKNQAKETLNTKVSDKVKEIEHEVNQQIVLDSYTPVVDQRRNSGGGIEDITNMNSKVSEDANSINLTITNDTPTLNNNRDYDLTTAIELGGSYYEYPFENKNLDNYIYLKGRKFTEETQKRVNESTEIIDIIKKDLGSK